MSEGLGTDGSHNMVDSTDVSEMYVEVVRHLNFLGTSLTILLNFSLVSLNIDGIIA